MDETEGIEFERLADRELVHLWLNLNEATFISSSKDRLFQEMSRRGIRTSQLIEEATLSNSGPLRIVPEDKD